VKVAKHLDGRDVRPGVVDDALRAVLDEVLEQDERLARDPVKRVRQAR
jgi:hypothetical protein